MTNNTNFNSRNTTIGKAVGLAKLSENILFRVFATLIWLFGAIAVIHYVAGFVGLIEKANTGLLFILISIFLIYLSLRSFYFMKILEPRELSLDKVKAQIAAGEATNLFTYLELDLAKVLFDLSAGKDIQTVTAKELALALLDSREIDYILLRLGISRAEMISAVKKISESGPALPLLLSSLDIALEAGHTEIKSGDLFFALCKGDQFFHDFMAELRIDNSDVENLVSWHDRIDEEKLKRRNWLDPDRLKLSGGIGRDWSFGYTNYLRQFSTDITETIKNYGLGLEVIGRDSEINQIGEALLHEGSGDVIVVGEPGIGKRTVILGFAKKVLEGGVATLAHAHIFQVNVDALLSGLNGPSELTERIARVLSEVATAGNAIIFIENINNLLSSGEAGKADVSEALIPYLENKDVHLIGTCDVAAYNKLILSNAILAERFTRVTVKEPDKSSMTKILVSTVPMIEARTKSFISYEALKETVRLADRYVINLPNPEKSITLLDGATAKAAAERGETIILPKDVDMYIKEKYDVPVGEVDEKEKSKLLNLEERMHQTIVGQNEAVKALADAMRRSRAQISDAKKPIGSFLFLGPTGVGKTATAKALAEVYFGGESKMLRFDMSEYQNKEDVYRLIGSNLGGQSEDGLLVSAVREKPFSLLLFDEFEKADPDILNLFLQILDEGFLTDGSGRKVSFQNTIIIATSNAGAEEIRLAIQNGIDYERTRKELSDYLQKQGIYKPELLNRFTSVIVFSPLTPIEIQTIATAMIEDLTKSVFENQGVKLIVNPDAITALSKIGFDPKLGARPMERVIEDKIQNLLATKLLSNELKKGDSFTITKEMV